MPLRVNPHGFFFSSTPTSPHLLLFSPFIPLFLPSLMRAKPRFARFLLFGQRLALQQPRCASRGHLLRRSEGGQVLNTSYIERLNGTLRERLATLTRKCRHAAQRLQALETGMYLIGSTYNFCCFHQALNKRIAGEAQRLLRGTPAMASGLTDHLWSLSELLSYKVAPAPWVEPKRRGRPRRHPVAEPSLPKRPRGRPRSRPLPDPNVPKRPRGRPRKIPLSTFTA